MEEMDRKPDIANMESSETHAPLKMETDIVKEEPCLAESEEGFGDKYTINYLGTSDDDSNQEKTEMMEYFEEQPHNKNASNSSSTTSTTKRRRHTKTDLKNNSGEHGVKKDSPNFSTIGIGEAGMENKESKDDILKKLQTKELKISKKRGRGKVWSVFGKIVSNDGEEHPDFVACRNCKHVYAYDSRSTSNLVKHKCYRLERDPDKIDIDNVTKNNVTTAFTQWIIKNCRPFTIADDKHFHSLLQYYVDMGVKLGNNVNIKKSLPHSTTVARNIDGLYEKCLQKVRADILLAKNGGFALTCDAWSDSYQNKDFLALTAHFILNGNLHKRLLGFKCMEGKTTTGANVHKKVNKLLSIFDCKLHSKSVIVTDRGLNMIAAFKENININCVDHLLNDALENSMEHVEAASIQSQLCRKLVKYFKKSGLNPLLKSPLQDYIPTRWISMYFVFLSIERNWTDIDSILRDRNELKRISSINISHVRDLIKVLEPFCYTSKKLKGVNYPTMHFVYPHIHSLKKRCTNQESDSEFIKSFKAILREELQNTVRKNLKIFHKIAVFLFPPTNRLILFTANERAEIDEACKDLMKFYVKKPSDAEQALTNANVFADFIFDEGGCEPEEKISRELTSYKNTTIELTPDFDILKWWESHKSEYPLLFQISCLVLGTPASSAPSERVLSLSGNMISDKGTSLVSNEKILEQIMFLHVNSTDDIEQELNEFIV